MPRITAEKLEAFYDTHYETLAADLADPQQHAAEAITAAAFLLDLQLEELKAQSSEERNQLLGRQKRKTSIKFHPDKFNTCPNTYAKARALFGLIDSAHTILESYDQNLEDACDYEFRDEDLRRASAKYTTVYKRPSSGNRAEYYIRMANDPSRQYTIEKYASPHAQEISALTNAPHSDDDQVVPMQLSGQEAFYQLFITRSIPSRFVTQAFLADILASDTNTPIPEFKHELIRKLLSDPCFILLMDTRDFCAAAAKATQQGIVNFGNTRLEIFLHCFMHAPDSLSRHRILKFFERIIGHNGRYNSFTRETGYSEAEVAPIVNAMMQDRETFIESLEELNGSSLVTLAKLSPRILVEIFENYHVSLNLDQSISNSVYNDLENTEYCQWNSVTDLLLKTVGQQIHEKNKIVIKELLKGDSSFLLALTPEALIQLAEQIADTALPSWLKDNVQTAIAYSTSETRDAEPMFHHLPQNKTLQVKPISYLKQAIAHEDASGFVTLFSDDMLLQASDEFDHVFDREIAEVFLARNNLEKAAFHLNRFLDAMLQHPDLQLTLIIPTVTVNNIGEVLSTLRESRDFIRQVNTLKDRFRKNKQEALEREYRAFVTSGEANGMTDEDFASRFKETHSRQDFHRLKQGMIRAIKTSVDAITMGTYDESHCQLLLMDPDETAPSPTSPTTETRLATTDSSTTLAALPTLRDLQHIAERVDQTGNDLENHLRISLHLLTQRLNQLLVKEQSGQLPGSSGWISNFSSRLEKLGSLKTLEDVFLAFVRLEQIEAFNAAIKLHFHNTPDMRTSQQVRSFAIKHLSERLKCLVEGQPLPNDCLKDIKEQYECYNRLDRFAQGLDPAVKALAERYNKLKRVDSDEAKDVYYRYVQFRLPEISSRYPQLENFFIAYSLILAIHLANTNASRLAQQPSAHGKKLKLKLKENYKKEPPVGKLIKSLAEILNAPTKPIERRCILVAFSRMPELKEYFPSLHEVKCRMTQEIPEIPDTTFQDFLADFNTLQHRLTSQRDPNQLLLEGATSRLALTDNDHSATPALLAITATASTAVTTTPQTQTTAAARVQPPCQPPINAPANPHHDERIVAESVVPGEVSDRHLGSTSPLDKLEHQIQHLSTSFNGSPGFTEYQAALNNLATVLRENNNKHPKAVERITTATLELVGNIAPTAQRKTNLKAIRNYKKQCRPYSKLKKIGKALSVLLGAVIGFVVGAVIGFGVGSLATGAAGAVLGMKIAAGVGGGAGTAASMGFWAKKKKNEPIKKANAVAEEAAKAFAK